MIPVTLVTGFLGSGKTTLLKEMVEGNRSRKLVVLVNEFSSLDVDGRLLDATDADVICLPGGSIFCRCLVTEFISSLRGIAEKYQAPARPIDGLVIEASGVADPRVIGRMLEETGLDATYRIAAIVTVVDPGTFLKLIHTLPNIRAQVESADLVLLNKADLHLEEKMQAAEDAVREIKPSATVTHCEHGRVDPALIPSLSRATDLEGEYSACRDPNFDSLEVTASGDIDLEMLRQLLSELAADVYRAKGHVISQGQLWRVDFTDGTLSITPAEGAVVQPGLALVLRGDTSFSARERLRMFPG